ncbi:MAG: polysaccharide biosynthesis C-terminal domain-containing protein [Ginsengibacter sp.]
MKLFKTFSIYTVTSFINKGMMFAILPFLTSVISPAQNGVLSLYSIFVMFVIPFTLLGFSNSIVMEYSRLDKKEYSSFFSSSLALSTASFFIMLILFYVFGSRISQVLGASYQLLFWGLLYAYVNIYFEGILAYLRTIDKPYSFLKISVVKNILEIFLIICLVIEAKKGIEGKVISSLIAGTVIFIFSIFYFHSQGLITRNIKRRYLSLEIRFGISQIFFQLNLFILASTDKYMIAHLLHDTPGLGIYFVANQFAFIINVIVTAFFISYQPQLYKYLGDLNQENKYRLVKIKYLFTGFLLICTIMLCLATPVFYNLFISNAAYHAGIPYVAWNAFAFFFWGLYALFLGYLYYYRQNKVIIVFSIVSSAICISMNYFLIREFGIMGAAYANLLTYFILFVIIFITVNRLFKIELPWFDFKKIFRFA